MIIVYAPQDINKKKLLWNEITFIIIAANTFTIVLGDFNEVRSAEERVGSSFCKRGAKYFNDFISQTSLCDLPLGGRRFTRMSKDGSKLSKLDCILVSCHFVEKWPKAQLVALPRELSDHCPLILKSFVFDFGPSPFKFYNLAFS